MKFDPNISILLVDDDAMVKSIIGEYLVEMGFKKIIACQKSTQALKIIKDNNEKIDLIISDWEMPNVTGLTLLKTIRNHPARFATPFILVTSQRSMERMKISQAAQWAVNCYIMKPFRLELLRTKIFEVMEWDEKVA